MNTEKLKNEWLKQKDKKFKYKELYTLLDEKFKRTGKSRNYQLKDWSRYFKFYKPNPKGQKFLINEIYDKPKEKVDNRGKSQGSRNNYKGIYAEYIDVLLLQYLQKEEDKLKDTCKIYTTNNKIAEATGIVNCNYRTAYNKREKFYNTVYKDFNIRTNKYCMKDVFDWTKEKIREIVRSSLKRLKNAEKLEYEFCYFVYIPYTAKVPTEDELEAIYIAEDETMKEMGVEHKKQIEQNYELYKKFNRKVLKKVQENFDYIQSIFKGYTISLWEDFELKSDTELKELMTKLNSLVINSLKEKPEKIQKSTLKNEKKEDWFAKENWSNVRNPFWKPWVFDRMSKKYIEHCYSFINILCDITAEDIVLKIKNCKNNKITNNITQQQKAEYKAEYKDEECIKLIDQMDFDDNVSKEIDELFEGIEIPY